MKRRKQREVEITPEIQVNNTTAIKTIFSALVPLFVKIKEGLDGDGKLKFFEKVGLIFSASGDIPDVIDAATDLPAEAWQGDYYDDAEIKTIVDHVRTLLPDDLEPRAEVITLQLMEWVLTTVSTVDVIVDELT